MINTSEANGVAIIEMARPPVNAMNLEFLEALAAAHSEACASGARAVVIAGREGLFSAGLDVPVLLQMDRAAVENFWHAFFRLMNTVAASSVPVAAAITGHAPAGGAVLALHCDYRVATRGDYRIGLNEVQVGLPVPSNILFILETIVGSRKAALLAMAGTMLSPEESLAAGLVDELADPEGAVRAACAWAEGLLRLPPSAMNTTRLAAKAPVLELAAANERYAAQATDYWFSSETQQMMRQLAANLGKK